MASAERSWSGVTGTARGRCQMPPHLLVVGARNSRDPGPARLRQEANRGARWLLQPIGEEIAGCSRHDRCFFDTARTDGIEISMWHEKMNESLQPRAARKRG